MKRQKAHCLGNITWSELGKQIVQAKKVYLKVIAGLGLFIYNLKY